MEIGKILLIGAGAYLLLRYLSPSASASGIPPAPASGASPAGTTQAGAPATANGSASAGQTGNVPHPGDENLMRAAVDRANAYLAGDYRQNWWEWNWYRMEGAKSILGIESPDPAVWQPKLDDKLSVTPQQMLTASEYHELLRQFGLSGLSWMQRW